MKSWEGGVPLLRASEKVFLDPFWTIGAPTVDFELVVLISEQHE